LSLPSKRYAGMKVLITGKNGQVGRDLEKSAPSEIHLVTCGHEELDIESPDSVYQKIGEEKPDVIINTAAYTAVDKAESDQIRAFAVNSGGIRNLARAASLHSARLVHLSTDFVFNGTKSSPYLPDDLTAPLSVYGKSKAEGEQQLLQLYSDNSIIIRTSWVYSVSGNNFVKTMLKLMKERDEIKVVADQIGSPTWSFNLALTIWSMVLNNSVSGIYHWSDAGAASWYDFAVAIQEEALALSLLDRYVNILPIATSQYPTPARRPAYSIMDTSATRNLCGVRSDHWRVALRKMLSEYKLFVQRPFESLKT